ncbi:GtrA family protein [Thalassospira sp.]|uniref:GtrA family protein n=1 Tax=Thalassospira sp. TaxID=1912094 RepID=UPI0027333175|nr:GtrA family protein [Thalassospira sp.]MDP2699704.1 GtrA family protein [Thalassospira sp.]
MKSAVRFVALGVITTAASYTTYVAALQILPPMSAYGIAVGVSLIIQACLMAPFVFRADLTFGRAAISMLIYAGYSSLFAGLMWIVLYLGVPPLIAPLLVIVIGAPLQYLAGRRWVRDPMA